MASVLRRSTALHPDVPSSIMTISFYFSFFSFCFSMQSEGLDVCVLLYELLFSSYII